jgi:ketosteroid isomerase-like protein
MTTHLPVPVSEFLQRWAAAETAGDPGAVAACLAEDFRAVGPLGFELSRADWVARHAEGALTYRRFTVDGARARPIGDAVVVLSHQHAEGTYRGAPVPSELRTTLVIGADADGPRLRHVHMSFVAGTPGAPALPGR